MNVQSVLNGYGNSDENDDETFGTFISCRLDQTSGSAATSGKATYYNITRAAV